LLSGLRSDDVGEVVRKDALILSLGKHLSKKFAGDREQFNYIRGKMRFLGKLLELCRKCNRGDSLSDFIHPTMFQTVMEVAQECAGFNESTGEFKVPSQAVRGGQLLRCVAELKEAKALQAGDTSMAESCVQFIKLCQMVK